MSVHPPHPRCSAEGQASDLESSHSLLPKTQSEGKCLESWGHCCREKQAAFPHHLGMGLTEEIIGSCLFILPTKKPRLGKVDQLTQAERAT